MSETFEMEWAGTSPEDVVETLAELESELEQRLLEAMETAVLLIESSAKQLAPVDTGRLRSSIASEVVRIADDVLEGHVGTNVDYAEEVEFGTSAHTITADSGVLAWETEGETHFARSVQHPGTEPQPFLRPAVEQHRGDIRQLFVDAVDDAIAEVS